MSQMKLWYRSIFLPFRAENTTDHYKVPENARVVHCLPSESGITLTLEFRAFIKRC